MKVIGFAQLHNELLNNNLENWLKCMTTVCDYIYVYDQASTDGSLDVYKTVNNLVVIESEINDFSNEIICKHKLLTKVLQDHPDVDFIFWMDGDTILDNRLLENNGAEFKQLCEHTKTTNTDFVKFGHYNLWRSDTHFRVDDNYHWLNGRVSALWRNTGRLHFPTTPGLHQPQYPNGLDTCNTVAYALIHRGFATDDQIIRKYERYRDRGQSGNALERLLNEHTLATQRLSDDLLPSWFELTDDTDPKTKQKIREIYAQR